MHHDTYAHYRYFAEKGIVPVIPLSEKSKNILPHSSGSPDVRLNADGMPLCPAGAPMRFHGYNKRKRTQVFSCPAKRNTHRDGKSVYVFHDCDCPDGKDCKPDSTMGPFVYIKSDTDPRLFPPIPRNSRKFKDIMNQRSGSERVNSVVDSYNIDGAHRNADYGLIRLYLANIVHHAVIRRIEALKTASPEELLRKVLQKIRARPPDS
ncbi:MAG: hypothetical protein GY820_21365 [Gammaproteobacteria bacterium]|nr:hypothetical protein [Gammaproteobacteria bacterium]